VADSRFSSSAARAEHDKELVGEISKVFASRTASEWEQLLTNMGVACVRADGDVGSFLEDHPQSAVNRMVAKADSPRFGKYLRHGSIVSFSDAPGRFDHGSFPGEHTMSLMRELGYAEDQIADLRARQIIHWEEVRRLPSAR
jgi:succinate--hydroxymethylglutarate CoA-transferase